MLSNVRLTFFKEHYLQFNKKSKQIHVQGLQLHADKSSYEQCEHNSECKHVC